MLFRSPMHCLTISTAFSCPYRLSHVVLVTLPCSPSACPTVTDVQSPLLSHKHCYTKSTSFWHSILITHSVLLCFFFATQPQSLTQTQCQVCGYNFHSLNTGFHKCTCAIIACQNFLFFTHQVTNLQSLLFLTHTIMLSLP